MWGFGTAAVLVAALAGAVAVAQAETDPAGPAALPAGWSVQDRDLVWTAPEPVTTRAAAVEFWSGDRMLGRARPGAELRSYHLDLPVDLDDLQVRAAGRRLDAPPVSARRGAAAPVLPGQRPAAAVDPGVAGAFETVTGEYSLPGVRVPGFETELERRAVVVAPKNAPGPRPLVVLLHGVHYTCHGDEGQTDQWPCPPGTTESPSFRGYLYAQQLLASQGYLTVSVSANSIDGQPSAGSVVETQARSSLVRLHLAAWADWAAGRAGAPAIVRAAGRADLSKVMLVGHSRGGEGVNQAALDSLRPPPAARDGYHGEVRWTVRGVVGLAPTAFGQNPVPEIPSVTVLPGCDGDLSDLQGQQYVDGTRGVGSGRALHSALYVIGANHNFFNSEWTPGQSATPSWDDAPSGDDALCAAGAAARLTASQQQAVGATYLAAAARLFLAGDDRVLPLLDGSGVRAPSAGPARVLGHALGGARTPALIPDTTVTVTGARLCEMVTDGCLPDRGAPHFVPFAGVTEEPGRYAIRLDGAATVRPQAAASLTGASELALRLIVPPNTTGNRFGVAVTDAAGRRADLGEVTLDGLPGTSYTSSYWAQEARIRLPRPLTSVTGLELTPRQAGPAWLIDAWGWRPGLPAPAPESPARVDVGELTVDEGDAGTTTHRVPVEVTGGATGQVRLFLRDPATGEQRSWVADVTPGTSRIDVPMEVVGDTLYGGDQHWAVYAKAVRNTLVGAFEGGLTVRENDPRPTVTIEPSEVTAAEGEALTWTVHLSAPAAAWLAVTFEIKPPAGPELSTTDVDPVWYRQHTFDDPEPSRQLSEAGLRLFVSLPPGETTADLVVPTARDDLAEGPEHVRWQALTYDADGPVPAGFADGTLTDVPTAGS
ncbi:alpha/beta hydrolase family protein [Catenuloplanes japonicus]|uniref:hypothetical protein n=1 Tax=Catenuloplanes japonicus TaxID=33876 RepID=UPI0005252351|nr:hypothetical protein [Catenuloplanes japonicus]